MKKIYVFHHSDLDGIGVKILGTEYAKLKEVPCETYKCNYNDVNSIIFEVLYQVLSDEEGIEEIIIGDISVDENVAEYLQNLYVNGVRIRLRDHHATAEWLNKYEWACVEEVDAEGIARCGTYLLSQEEDFKSVREKMGAFIEAVDSWDTWKWKAEENYYAKNLNALLQILGEAEFTEYINSLYSIETVTHPSQLFNQYAKTMVLAHEYEVKRVAKSCKNSMWTTKIEIDNNKYNTGIVFCNHDISDVSDAILSNSPEIDILMLVGFPRNISFRTQKDLNIPLGDVAKLVTGSGGGHPKSAGAVISQYQFRNLFEKSLDILSSKKLKYGELKLNKKEE